MPNKNYIKGRNKEYAIVKKKREEGCEIAQRTAGSHSPFDVIAINREKKTIYLIQSKPNNFSKLNTKRLHELNDWLTDEFKVIFEVI